MAKHINTFTKGLDKDTNVNAYSNESYPHALNLRILSEESLESGTLTNIEDKFPVISTTGEVILNVSSIGDRIVVFSRDASKGSVQAVPDFGNIRVYNESEFRGNTALLLDSKTPLVRKKFRFGDNIEVVARYETNSVQKLYWVDGINTLRVINIAESNLQDKPLTYFNVTQEVVLTEPKFGGIITGSLKTGMYQYAYSLYNKNGGETGYSSATSIIPISESSFSNNTSHGFKGSHSGEVSFHGISININNIDERFSNIRVIRMYYSTQDGLPEITIIHEGSTQSSMTINDHGGVVLGTLVLEDYRHIPNLFVASTLESTNDFLFAGNIKDSYFDVDVDMRAYRFNSDRELRVWNRVPAINESWWDSSHKYTSGDAPDWNIDKDFVVNPYNVPKKSYTTDFQYKYQADGVTIGGEGENIKYRFITRERIAEHSDSSTPLWYFTEDYQDMSNPTIIESNLGYQRGEVYRFGIVFYDKYGRQSFVKWIDDIKFPDEGDGFVMIRKVLPGGVHDSIHDLLIEFTITANFITSLPENIVSFQIVRAERTYSDATVKDCGYFTNLWLDGSSKLKFPSKFGKTHEGSGYSGIMEYITPETNYNKNNNINYPIIQATSYSYTSIRKVKVKRYIDTNNKTASPVIERVRLSTGGSSPVFRDSNGTMLLKASKTLVSRSTSSIGGSRSIPNTYRLDDTTAKGFVSKGTTLLVNVSSRPFQSRYSFYGRRISTSLPYGGYSRAAIESTQFYPVSGLHQLTINENTGGLGSITTGLQVAKGDCYIGIFEYMRGLCTTDETIVKKGKNETISENLGSEVLYLPVETKINLKYTVNDRFSTLDNGDTLVINDINAGFVDGLVYNAMWETKGVHEGGDSQTFEQDFDLYTYNPVYSSMDKSKVFFIKPPDLELTYSLPQRIMRTSKKINGEPADTWTKFPVNNYLDLDTAQGSLTKLLTFKNNLYFFQEKGVGALPIEQREVVSTESGNITTIGVGGVMERYDYISRNSGTNSVNSIVPTNSTIYFADTYNNKLSRIGENIEPISDILGLKSVMVPLTGTSALFNSKYNEVWFNLPNNETYVYNEYTNTFVSEVDEYFKIGVSIGDLTLGVTDTEVNRLNLEGSIRSWELDLVVNPNSLIVNRYDSLTFGSINKTSNVSIPFETLQLTNRYQDSGIIQVDNRKLRRRFRNWVFNTIREDGTRERFYDSYMKVSLSGSNAVEIYDVLTEYTAINTL